MSQAVAMIAKNNENLAIMSDHVSRPDLSQLRSFDWLHIEAKITANKYVHILYIFPQGVVQYLARLAPTTDDMLRQSLASAIAECCKYKHNASEFGRRKAVSPLCSYLTSEDPLVHRAAAQALSELSVDHRNCITMHQCGVVPYLINMIGSLDGELQKAAAGVMFNIRQLALSVEKVRLR